MKILILHQPFPMGNYKLMPYIGEYLKNQGHEVYLLQQLNGSPLQPQFLEAIQSQNFDSIYYEMLDSETFKMISELKGPKRILCYASKGIFEDFDSILKYKGQLYDSVLTNSKQMSSKFTEQGVENQFFEYYPAPLNKKNIKYKQEYNLNFVYLGGGFQRLVKPEYEKERELIYQNPKVYKFGAGWENVPNYIGVLPPEDIGSLYYSAKCSIGTIEPSQRKMGMINNRYSEMFRSGNRIISIDYPGVDFYGGEEFIIKVNTLEDIDKVDFSFDSKQKDFILDKEQDFFNKLCSII